MNMKRIMITLAALALTFTVSAQQGKYNNYFGLTFGGGLNTFTYDVTHGTHSLGMGFDAGLHYTHFYNEHFGLGLGVHYSYVNAFAKYNFKEISSGLTHANNQNMHYDLTTTFNNWKERQTVGVLRIPVEAFYRTAINDRWNFIGGLGVQLDLPLHGEYSASEGSYATTGTFAALGSYVVSDLPEHGFSTYDATFKSKIKDLAVGLSVLFDAGVRMALHNNWGLYFGIYGSYGLTDILGEDKNAPLLMINTKDASKIDYNGTFASREVNSLHLLTLGVKVGIDLGWSPVNEKPKMVEPITPSVDEEALKKAEAERLAAEKAKAEKLAAEKAAREKAEAERKARQKAEADRLAAEKAAKEKAKAEAERKLKAINATVYFDNAGTKAKFDPQTDSAIHAICDAMKIDNTLQVTIYGHTDNTGSAKANVKYGQKRAEALKEYMVKLGAPAENIECLSKGQDEPIADNKTKDGRALNRRATVSFK